MPRSTPRKDDSARAPRDPRRREILREARLLCGGALLLLLLVALLSYDPTGAAGGLAGKVGQFLARWTFRVFGLTSFLVVPLSLFWIGLRFFRRGQTRPWERASGLVMVTLAMAAGLALTVETTRYASLAEGGPGGVLGAVVRDGLVWTLGSVGAFLAVVIGFLVGLALFTDWLVFEMAAEVASSLKALGPWFRRMLWPEPVAPAPATASGAPGADERTPPAPRAAAASSAAVALEPPTAPKPSLRERLFGGGKGVEGVEAEAKEEGGEPAPEAEPKAGRKPEPKPAAKASVDEDEEGEDEAEENEAGTPDEAVGPVPAKGSSPPIDRTAAPPKPRPVRRKPAKTEEGEYEFPPADLLDKTRVKEVSAEEETIQANARILEQTLQDFKIDARVVGYTRGPVVTMLEIALAAGTKVTRIHALADDLAMALKAQTVRVVAPIPGKSTVGVEVPNLIREDVRLRGLLETETFLRSKAHIPLLLGVDAGGAHRIEDLASMPHLLIAGATGSGKSVCINSIIMSVLMTRTPSDVRLILVDPKQVELSFFSRIPHLLSPVVTDMKRAVNVLEWAVNQMEERYDLLALMQVRSIASYNELGPKSINARLEEVGDTDRVVPTHLPYVVIVVDELADLMMTAGKDIEVLITRLAQKSRAVGIHVVLATQRPSTDVITGLIKANMPTRICFKVTSKVDSRVVMDQNGGDRLLGQGDMLYLPPRTAGLIRAQATFVADAEVKRVVEFLAKRHEPQFNRELTQVCTGALLSDDEKDELYDQAVRVVLEEQRGSASLLQRALEIGYTRASRLLDLMRKEGIVGAYKGSKASEVIVSLEDYEARVAAARSAPAVDDADEGDEDES